MTHHEEQHGWRPDPSDVSGNPEPTDAPADPDLSAPGSADDERPAPVGGSSDEAFADEYRGGGAAIGRDLEPEARSD